MLDLGFYLVIASFLSSIPVWVVALAIMSIAETAKKNK
jgi:hypothetical protein